ncbi:SMC family ATPase (plasmid) [Polaromonas sp. P1-6]|nr:SMC family ATPase [Polaromonas sp. P1-6]
MRPIRLKLEGFTGIASGRGKPAIEIHLDSINTDSKMVVLKGPNGAGKTTIMDNLHPYRVMPSRSTSPTPTSFSYYDHLVEGSDGLKEFDWEHEGTFFRSTIRMKAAGKAKKQEAYLFVKRGSDFQPYQDESGLISDGKTDTYDRAVEAVLGKPEVFFTALFSAQGKTPISTMSASEVKTLMASMLGMEGMRALAGKASDVIKGLKPHLGALQSQVVPLEQSISSAQLLEGRKAELHTNVALLDARIKSAKNNVRDKLTELSSLEAAAGQQEQVKAKKSALTSQLESARAENEKQFSAFVAKQISEAQQSLTQVGSSRQAVRIAENAVTSAQLKLTDAQALVNKGPEITAAEQARKEAVAQLSNLKAQADNLFLDANRMSALQQAVTTLRDAFTTERAGGINLSQIIEAAQKTAALIKEVPCSGHAFAGSCQLLAQARIAEDGLKTQHVELQGFRDRCGSSRAKLDANSRELDILVEADTKFKELQLKINELELKVANAKALLADAPRIEDARKGLQALKDVLHAANSDLTNAQAALDRALAAEQALVSGQVQQRQDFQLLLNKEVFRLENALAELPAVVEMTELVEAKGAVTNAERAVEQLDVQIEQLRDQLREVETSLAGVDSAKGQLKVLSLKTDAISQEVAHWTLLNRALGNDGIVAMCIDDAGPSISALCNNLLQDCYGGRFVVRLSTQAATATGVLKESFVIHVEDTLRGEQKLLDDMSGGEKVWINECLVRAMALYMTQSSGSKFQTLFSDEADGPLDPVRKRQFMSMKRAVLERGGYSREYLITQTPELMDLCDAAIDVTTL